MSWPAVRLEGRYYAGAFAASSFAPLTSLPIAGALISATGGQYWALVVFTGLCYGVAAVCFVAARVKAVGWNYRKVF
ncbi:hypothetical protein Slin15195_G041770 [Septoria linicola]|uniref:Uncharacterized protein n=1 Tax=Septoria linicola TaxID=215465 RepID=A0A9Q9APQ1_9PEZI|nr:hypothetical protein Slin15195_G041770 [Septoria linicola]